MYQPLPSAPQVHTAHHQAVKPSRLIPKVTTTSYSISLPIVDLAVLSTVHTALSRTYLTSVISRPFFLRRG